MWKNVTAAPPDSILGLTEAFRNDPNPEKVNLGVGVYMTDEGTVPILGCVTDAERILLGREQSKGYLPIAGDPLFGTCVQKLIFGPGSEVIRSGRATTAHTPGGTGALRVGAELLKTFLPDATVWLSTPTWANHKGIFSAAGFPFQEYPYYNPETKGLKYDEMLERLKQIPAGDIVLFHACCHNPSGVDLNGHQWQEVAEIATEKGWIPFLDFAYQGFGSSIDEDRIAVETFARKGINFFVASSFSKNLGLYSERAGAITLISSGSEESAIAASHLKKTIRVCYSNPPAHGGLIAMTILSEPALEQAWRKELTAICTRIISMRNALVDRLDSHGIDQDFSFIRKQRGLFSFSGLSPETVSWLRNNKGIYVVEGGRINIAGLTTKNIDYVCDSIAEALK
ncbi:MAG: aromatic amino acid aminotransferase [Proteobacteria bacterium]|nr:MAG: aromatic amino acid aminotransferase [Pseudomonadota bacterium]